jgi:hypothetical protein
MDRIINKVVDLHQHFGLQSTRGSKSWKKNFAFSVGILALG